MKNTIFTALILSLAILSCTKKTNCENAQIRVMNTGTDTVYFGWDTAGHNMVLPPSQSAYRNVGKITNGNFVVVNFNSTKGDFPLHVEKCYQEFEIK